MLLLDEPASGLDDTETDRLRDLLLELRDEGLAVLVVEHDLDLVRETADSIMVMATGRILATGRASEVLTRPEVRAVVTGPVG